MALTNADSSVQVVFKSSPFGTQSHGYEANNSFLLWAYGKRLLIRSGRRDSYGSKHHKEWMWSTRSVNNITVPDVDVVIGEAGRAYEPQLERFTRAIIFVKPELVIVYDRLKSREPSTYEYWLHAVNKIDVKGQHQIQVRNDDVACDIDFLTPSGLSFEQTNQYDPNPRPRITLREWHLTATTPEKKKQMEFVTLYRPHKVSNNIAGQAKLSPIPGGYILRVTESGKKLTALLPTDDTTTLEADGLTTTSAIKLKLESKSGESPQILEIRQGNLY